MNTRSHKTKDNDDFVMDEDDTYVDVIGLDSSGTNNDSSVDNENESRNESQPEPNTNQEVPEWSDVIKQNDYYGRDYWNEPFITRVLDAIKNKNLDMNTGKDMLGVPYGTLYGRYTNVYGPIKQPHPVPDVLKVPGAKAVLESIIWKKMSVANGAKLLKVPELSITSYLECKNTRKDRPLENYLSNSNAEHSEDYKRAVKRNSNLLDKNRKSIAITGDTKENDPYRLQPPHRNSVDVKKRSISQSGSLNLYDFVEVAYQEDNGDLILKKPFKERDIWINESTKPTNNKYSIPNFRQYLGQIREEFMDDPNKHEEDLSDMTLRTLLQAVPKGQNRQQVILEIMNLLLIKYDDS